MRAFADTHALVWFATGNPRLSDRARAVLLSEASEILVSVTTAFEYADLWARGRFPPGAPLGPLLAALAAVVLPFAAKNWEIAAALPDRHRDPVDRMLIAHAIAEDAPVLTADTMFADYPITVIW